MFRERGSGEKERETPACERNVDRLHLALPHLRPGPQPRHVS